jgi:deaminated glutathione amidase
MTKSVEPYNALALQVTCHAVNGLSSRQDVSQRMAKTIANIADQIRGSKGFISSFSGLNTRLVVLPEYFLTGFPMGESVEVWSEKACIEMEGPEYLALGKICQDNDIFLSGNVYELDPNFPGIYFQVSFIIDPSGEVVLRYRRLISMYAPTPHDVLERYIEVYGEESLFPVVDTEIGRLAAVASEEILYPEIIRALTLRGAEVICHSSSEVGSPLATPKNIAKQARAYENMVYIVSANSAGIVDIAFPAASTDGGSKVVDFHGSVLAEASVGESMCGNAEVDVAALRSARLRPGMTNILARQRLEIFAPTYERFNVYPANNLLADGEIIVPDRKHFVATQLQVIEKLIKTGILAQ